MWILVIEEDKSFRYISIIIVLKSALQKKQLIGVSKTSGTDLYFGVLAKAMTGLKKHEHSFLYLESLIYILAQWKVPLSLYLGDNQRRFKILSLWLNSK